MILKRVEFKEEASPPRNNCGKRPWLRALFDIKLSSIYLSIKDYLINEKGKVLDVGCGDQPYRSLVRYGEYHGIESWPGKTGQRHKW